jgi:hypothetical protein
MWQWQVRGEESRAKADGARGTELRLRTRSPLRDHTPPEGGGSPRSACSAFCLLRRRPAQNGKRETGAAPQAAGLETRKFGGRREAEREREQSQAGAKA